MTCVARITKSSRRVHIIINVEAKTSGLGLAGNDIHEMSLGHDVMAHLLERTIHRSLY